MDQDNRVQAQSRGDLGFLTLLAPEIRGSFSQADWVKDPVWHDQSRKLEMVLANPVPLPFEAYESLLTALRLRFHCSIDLRIEAADSKADLSLLDSYISLSLIHI